jgi:branched-chain amino acid transport system permease protein
VKSPARLSARLGVILALLAAGVVLSPFNVSLLTDALIYGILACSLDLLMGYTGLPSLGHAAYFGIGGYVIGLGVIKFTTIGAVGLLLAAVGGAAFAALTSWFAVRARGVYYLMLTFAFAQLLLEFVQRRTDLTGGDNGVTDVPSFTLLPGIHGDAFSGGRAFYFYAAVVFLICYYLMRRVVGSPFGRSIQGIRENEGRMQAFGYNVLRYKVFACVLAGGFGALAGGLAVEYQRTIFPSALSVTISILLLIMVTIGGAGTLFGPVVGAMLIVYMQNELSSRFARWETILGVVFVLSVYFLPKGLAGAMKRIAERARPAIRSGSAWSRVQWLERFGGRRRQGRPRPEAKAVDGDRLVAVPSAASNGPPEESTPPGIGETLAVRVPAGPSTDSAPALELNGVTKAFGSLMALQDVSFFVGPGERVALIGPNGAGKTTLVDVVTGRTEATRGRIHFAGKDVTRMPQHRRARLGMARTFQRSTLFEGLSVFDNVCLAVQQAEGLAARPLRDVARFSEVKQAADELLKIVHLSASAEVSAAELSHGERRQLEIAMGLATSPSVLLLDEPSAGMSRAETTALVSLLKALPSSLTLLIVEHDMDLVFEIASRIVVLHAGRVLADGHPDRIAESTEVRAAYLGAAILPIVAR